ncbi:glycerate kinase [Pontibacillus sp. ALD_SL1]|uniref:glycerate kinase n=1 Tax=Pontibacillus sp. ALD_SL1 TaxID=2777185 RepID=UPI001A97C10F|nr:glycerate kinase [Pontibacillus sp. ALD_SL1]QST01030.1 glycerate kinase [Pontibacillus sp. ALD_SL1]
MKVIVAPDSFKGSLSGKEVCEAVTIGIHAYDSDIEVQSIPIADGGEGTAEAFTTILGGQLISERVEDPLGRPVDASFGWVEETKTAIVETAAASGLPLLQQGELNPYKASTYGTGQLITAALDHGAEQIILGLGGSATVDAGSGCFQALGVKFLDQEGGEMKMNGGALRHVSKIDTSQIDRRAQNVQWLIASDVTNPLLGKQGAISVFGPQKGVQEEDIPAFETGMEHYADLLETATGATYQSKDGSGAAGGFGFTLYALLKHVRVESGFTLMARLGELESRMRDADLVITGEGKIDEQTLYGKGPIGIARLAKEIGVPCVGFAGKMQGDLTRLKDEGLLSVLPIVEEPVTLEEAMQSSSMLLQHASKRCMEVYHLNR